jgi:hypothetical protein
MFEDALDAESHEMRCIFDAPNARSPYPPSLPMARRQIRGGAVWDREVCLPFFSAGSPNHRARASVPKRGLRNRPVPAFG